MSGYHSLDYMYANGLAPYAIISSQRANLGSVKVGGIDAQIAYRKKTSFGSVNLSVNGNRQLQRDQRVTASSAPVDVLAADTPLTSFSASLGATVGQLTGQATVNYVAGYTATNLGSQTHVSSFAPINRFFSYNLKGDAWWSRDTSVTLNVENVLERAPPYANNTFGITNGRTLGGVFVIGFEKRF